MGRASSRTRDKHSANHTLLTGGQNMPCKRLSGEKYFDSASHHLSLADKNMTTSGAENSQYPISNQSVTMPKISKAQPVVKSHQSGAEVGR